MSILGSIRTAWRGIGLDQGYMAELNPKGFRRNNNLLAVLVNPSLRFAFWARLASFGGPLGRLARLRLLHAFSSDVTPGCTFSGGIYAPHPTGIVIGTGTQFMGNVSIYQGVTFGGDRLGGYPVIGNGCKVFPNAVVIGPIAVGSKSTIGAGLFVDYDVNEGVIVRQNR